MSLQKAYEWAVALATTLSFGAVVWAGHLPWVLGLSMAAPLVALMLRQRGHSMPVIWGTCLGLLGMGYGIWTIWTLGIRGVLVGMAGMLVAVLAARVLTRRTLEEDLQALLLSLMLIFAGAILDGRLSYGVVFVLYAIATVWALVARQLVEGAHRESIRNAQSTLALVLQRRDLVTPRFWASITGLTVLIFMGTGVLFLAFPRVGLGSLGFLLPQNASAPRGVSLRAPARGQAGNSSVVARIAGVRQNQFERGVYLRGQTYSQLKEDGFEISKQHAQIAMPWEPRPISRKLQKLEIFQQPLWPKTVMRPGFLSQIKRLGSSSIESSAWAFDLGFGQDGDLLAPKDFRGPLRFMGDGLVMASLRDLRNEGSPIDAALLVPKDVLALEGMEVLGSSSGSVLRFQALPDALAPNLHTLVDLLLGAQKTSNTTKRSTLETLEIVDALRDFFLLRFIYALGSDHSGSDSPLLDFLESNRRGHCEYFATGFASLLRAAKIPSRVVGGFYGGVRDPRDGTVIFNQSHAHVWVEWFLPGLGWVVDDATPAAPRASLQGFAAWRERLQRFWDRGVVNYGLVDQIDAWHRISGALRLWRSETSFLPEKKQKTLPFNKMALFGFLVCCVLGGAFWFWQQRQRSQSSMHLYQKLKQGIERLGEKPLAEHQTLREAWLAASDWAQQGNRVVDKDDVSVADFAALLEEGVALYEQERFGSKPHLDVKLRWYRSMRCMLRQLKA